MSESKTYLPWKIRTKDSGLIEARGVHQDKEYLVECSLLHLNETKNLCVWSAWLFGENWFKVGENKYFVPSNKRLKEVFPEVLLAFEETILSPMEMLATELK